MMHKDDLVALIAEGAAEQAILEVLLDHNLMKFKRSQLLDEEVLRTRSGKQFSKQHLDHGFGPGQHVHIFRILDSQRENFRLGKAYLSKVSGITNIYTSPEIEMLFVIYFDSYNEFQKSKMKPSKFINQYYRKQIGENIKSKEVVYGFWNRQPDILVSTIKKYDQLFGSTKKPSLLTLLKDN